MYWKNASVFLLDIDFGKFFSATTVNLTKFWWAGFSMDMMRS